MLGMKTTQIIIAGLLMFVTNYMCYGQQTTTKLVEHYHFSHDDISQDSLKSLFLAEYAEDTPYIFEGTILESETVKDENGEDWHAYVVEVHKVFRGDLDSGTVEVIYKAPLVHYDMKIRDCSNNHYLQDIAYAPLDTTNILGTFFVDSVDNILTDITIKQTSKQHKKEYIFSNEQLAIPSSSFTGTLNNSLKLGRFMGGIAYNLGHNLNIKRLSNEVAFNSVAVATYQGQTIGFSTLEEIYTYLWKLPDTNFQDYSQISYEIRNNRLYKKKD